MIKKCFFAVGLLSLALAGGCAKGGNGEGSGITVTVAGDSRAGVTLTTQFTATVSGSTNTAVTWSITGASCSGGGNPCGSFTTTTATSATYQAPAAVPSNPNVTIQAASQADPTAIGTQGIKIVPITTEVSPTPVNVGQNLVQQFTAVALPDNAPQTFTWSCTINGAPCVNFSSDTSGVATYTAQDGTCGQQCVQISAASTIDPTGCTVDAQDCTVAKVSVLPSRLTNGTYVFQFSGYDGSNKPVAVAGAFTVLNGAITGGTEDELTSSGPQKGIAITGGSYTPIAVPNSSNNAGTLKLTTANYPNQYQIALNALGEIQMIETDGHGTGSGVATKSAAAQFNTAGQTFAFGLSGTDSSGNRVGLAGRLPMDGAGHINGGQMDVNDNGNTTILCGSGPCNVSGMYSADANGLVWHLTLSSGVTLNFDFFVATGQTANATNPLTLYAISTDAFDTTHSALSGAMVFQDPTQTYNNAAFHGTSTSALIGSSANVALIAGSTDGNGNFGGIFDQNSSAGILSQVQFPPVTGANAYTYNASGTNGRYIFNLLGNPNGPSVVPPVPFILWASGANRGFLLDQSSSAVMTGVMNPQPNNLQNNGGFAPSALPGTWAVTTNSNTDPNVTPVIMNLLLTSTGIGDYNVVGTQNPGNLAVTGSYNVLTLGPGTMTFTSPPPNPTTYAFYMIDLTDFYMIQENTTGTAQKPVPVPSPLYIGQQ